jgi:hypothetical protein
MALTCKLTRDILRTTSCGYSLPEVKDIWLANYADVTTTVSASTVPSGCTGEEVNIGTGATFYHIEPAKNSTTFEDALVVEDNGNRYRTHTLTFNISGKYDPCLHLDLDNLSLGRYLAVVATADGNYLMLGRLTGLEAETATLSGGGDTNGLQIVLSANVAESVLPLSESAVAIVKGE